jgi:hypothetical protein
MLIFQELSIRSLSVLEQKLEEQFEARAGQEESYVEVVYNHFLDYNPAWQKKVVAT